MLVLDEGSVALNKAFCVLAVTLLCCSFCSGNSYCLHIHVQWYEMHITSNPLPRPFLKNEKASSDQLTYCNFIAIVSVQEIIHHFD